MNILSQKSKLMKIKLIIILALLSFLWFSCNDNDEASTLPKCFQTIIDDVLKKAPITPRSSIDLYSYNNQEVFLLKNLTNGADLPSFLRNSRCGLICLIGGIGGELSSSAKCSDFYMSSSLIKNIWVDER